MSFNEEYENACKKESQRLRIAEGWARLNLSDQAREFERGHADRVAGKPCRSANGDYLDGWYFEQNPTSRKFNGVKREKEN